MEPFSIVTGVIGTAAVAVQAAQELKTMLGDLRDAPREVRDLRAELQSLEATFGSLRDLVDRGQRAIAASCPDLARHIEQDIRGSTELIAALREALSAFIAGAWLGGASGDGVGRTGVSRLLSKMVDLFNWTTSKGHVRQLRSKLNDRQFGLVLRIEVLNGYAPSTLLSQGRHLEIKDHVNVHVTLWPFLAILHPPQSRLSRQRQLSPQGLCCRQ